MCCLSSPSDDILSSQPKWTMTCVDPSLDNVPGVITQVEMISDEDDNSLWPSSEGEMGFLCDLGHQLEYRTSS